MDSLRTGKVIRYLRLSAFICGLALFLSAAEKPVIYRDTYGVPHIYGKTDADVVFGLMYAQAAQEGSSTPGF